ncbi:putative ABC transporter ATP-binding protein YknY [Candidatus Kuenenia stuttgartiensis]|uniref:Putative ABC transporter ATP-binding protein YknY n=2 Tax=Candidatus Brocadiaceae TaxID=1127830 RepID=Q1Q5Z3_KUEST|nr:ABC transporter ATP-binding protein [Planctomycetia bacterium]MBZ0191567.1 ABC transporter ATP-binding protein [Candidatus Kuenenia stuttgartiensis]MCL4727732.1 ABC transporter ATP-binding protein [Candidatus Kuenenia stuttgartiensis]QII13202.1 putative ABC transporter ATP-binding protein YknY [Candidatus Kuenenia stuttgartiensis]TVL96817.1 MAG: ABC transporter ATP-binding protein [Candidatus Kuenenia stuttgartiensis]
MIRMENIRKWYNANTKHEVRAVEEVNLTIAKNSFVVLKGPSGSGKTTLLNIIGTLDRPTTGKVFINEEEITAFSDIALSVLRREKIGFIFQDFMLIPRLPSWENVSYPLIPVGIGTKERFKRAKTLLDMMDLGERVTHTPEELSGGQQQRVAIARALINNPGIIIADEPTSNIDEETCVKLMNTLIELKNRGATIVVAAHDPRFKEIADETFTMRNGRLQ